MPASLTCCWCMRSTQRSAPWLCTPSTHCATSPGFRPARSCLPWLTPTSWSAGGCRGGWRGQQRNRHSFRLAVGETCSSCLPLRPSTTWTTRIMTWSRLLVQPTCWSLAPRQSSGMQSRRSRPASLMPGSTRMGTLAQTINCGGRHARHTLWSACIPGMSPGSLWTDMAFHGMMCVTVAMARTRLCTYCTSMPLGMHLMFCPKPSSYTGLTVTPR
mmetsp:Transcript_38290/g.85267  ORF Transcript_38290/g.85267 Transcript_38290/m.85267 type:complete len:215 (+) Transcript_38290:978-1622(+)